MSFASSSGADKGSAKYREHSHGRQDRDYNPEQKAAVERIKKCKTTAYYEILAVTKEATDSQIKKAYHKLSLQTHPDKNGAPGADEAFKMVSKAFQVLSNSQQRTIYDQTGSDPESRGGGGGGGGGGSTPGGNPFSAFTGARPGGAFEAEISPEDLFNMFFGGGGGMGGFGGFGDGAGGFASFGGPGFGGPGIRVHQFGGTGPRVRRRAPPRTAEEQAAANEPLNIRRIFWQLLPLLIFLSLPILTSLLSGDSDTPRGPRFEMNPVAPYTQVHHTPDYNIPFYVNPVEVEGMSRRDMTSLDKTAEVKILRSWTYGCKVEQEKRQSEIEASQGIFFTDKVLLEKAKRMPMPHCKKLEEVGIRKRGSHY